MSGAVAAGAEVVEALTEARALAFVLLALATLTLSGLKLTAQSDTSKMVATVIQM
ncbi:MAG: hypothetical protein ACXV7G_08985 [Halobacteriota archaeon]